MNDASERFGANIEAQLAANRQVVQAGVASVGSRIWPQNNADYGGPTPVGTRIQGQILEVVNDYWPNGDPRVKVILRDTEREEYNVTLGKFSLPAWDQSPGKVGDWIVFEVASVKPAKVPGKYYVETAFALQPGHGAVTIPSAQDPDFGDQSDLGALVLNDADADYFGAP